MYFTRNDINKEIGGGNNLDKYLNLLTQLGLVERTKSHTSCCWYYSYKQQVFKIEKVEE